MAEDIIRQLIAETNALPRHELPSTWAWAKNHPGILSYRTKSPQRYDQDMRRAHFLEKVRERDRDTYWGSPELLDASREMDALRSPYQEYGADWPVYNATRWFGSFPGAVYAGGQMLANAVDPVAKTYPKAYDDLARNVNNIVAVAEPLGTNKNHMRDMVEMRDAQDSIPWDAMIPRQATDKALRQRYEQRADPKIGSEYLREAKVDGPTADVLGAVMDATFDPFFSRAKTLGGFAVDYGLGTAHGTLPVAVETIRKLRGGY